MTNPLYHTPEHFTESEKARIREVLSRRRYRLSMIRQGRWTPWRGTERKFYFFGGPKMTTGKELDAIGYMVYGTDRYKRRMAADLGVAPATITYARKHGVSDREGLLSGLKELVAAKISELRARADKLEALSL